MKRWSITINMSQNLTGFDVFSSRQISSFAKAERRKLIENGKAQSYSTVTDKKPLLPIESWIIQMVFEEFKRKYEDIENVKIMEIEIKALGK